MAYGAVRDHRRPLTRTGTVLLEAKIEAGTINHQCDHLTGADEQICEVPPAGFEPAPPPPEGGALSPELRGLGQTRGYQSVKTPTPGRHGG